MATAHSGRTAAIALFVALAVAVLNLALWILYRDSRAGLEAELARRLENVAVVLGRTLDPALVQRARSEHAQLITSGAPPESLLTAAAYDSLRGALRDIAVHSDIANVRIFDDTGVAFLDLAAGADVAGAPEIDPAGVVAALAGASTHSALYQSGREYLMAGYAPVPDSDGVSLAAVAVEADARYFEALGRLRFAMAASAVLSGLVLAGLGLTFARLQSSLQRAEAALQRAETLAAMGRMAAGIAHEIRNPLGIIKATAARLRKRYDDPQRPDERFVYIDEEVDRLNGILSGYLQLARDEAPRLEKLDLVPLVERGLRLVRPELDAAHIAVETNLPKTCVVAADGQRLQQVILNLVLNAVQAMPAGGTLRVRLAAADGVAALAFADTGPGFDPAVQSRLFEPFVSTKEKGSGLGLAIARRIVEQHGGRILVDEAPGGGAQVAIHLPLAAAAGGA
jgi:signal transduction histidine kinase